MELPVNIQVFCASRRPEFVTKPGACLLVLRVQDGQNASDVLRTLEDINPSRTLWGRWEGFDGSR